jgi:hypothetical protein
MMRVLVRLCLIWPALFLAGNAAAEQTRSEAAAGAQSSTSEPPAKEPSGSRHTRLAVGVEQSAFVGSASGSKLLFDFFVSGPFDSDDRIIETSEASRARDALKKQWRDKSDAERNNARKTEPQRWAPLDWCDPFEELCIRDTFLMWGEFRLTGVSQETVTNAQALSSFGVKEVSAGAIAQGLVVVGGVQQRLTRGVADPGPSLDPNGKVRFGLWAIAGAGFATPVNPSENRDIFMASDEAKLRHGLPPSTEYIAFVPPDRSRLYRQYFAGLRIGTHRFVPRSIQRTKAESSTQVAAVEQGARPKPATWEELTAPGFVDITLGQNEGISGGKFRGLVGRLDAFVPLPFGRPDNTVYLFGSLLYRLASVQETAPLILRRPDAAVPVPGPNVAIIHTATPDRDAWKIGIAIDLGRVFNSFNAPQKPAAAQTTERQAK